MIKRLTFGLVVMVHAWNTYPRSWKAEGVGVVVSSRAA